MTHTKVRAVGLVLLVWASLLGAAACTSQSDATEAHSEPAVVEYYVASSDLPYLLILSVIGGPDDTATAKIVSQDKNRVVVSAEIQRQPFDGVRPAVGFEIFAIVHLDAPLRGRDVLDQSGSEVQKNPLPK